MYRYVSNDTFSQSIGKQKRTIIDITDEFEESCQKKAIVEDISAVKKHSFHNIISQNSKILLGKKVSQRKTISTTKSSTKTTQLLLAPFNKFCYKDSFE
jgi:hypothetical protein